MPIVRLSSYGFQAFVSSGLTFGISVIFFAPLWPLSRAVVRAGHPSVATNLFLFFVYLFPNPFPALFPEFFFGH